MSETSIYPLSPKRFIMVYATDDLNVDFDETVAHYMSAYDEWYNARTTGWPVINNSKPATLLRLAVHVVQDLVDRDVGGGRADAYLAAKAHLEDLKHYEQYVLLVDQVSAIATRIFLSLPDEVSHVRYVAYPHGCVYVYAGDRTLEYVHTHNPRIKGEPNAQST